MDEDFSFVPSPIDLILSLREAQSRRTLCDYAS
jgi:hypothetical protein